MIEKFTKLWRDREAATSVEYAIMASLIAAIVIASVAVLGVATEGMFARASVGWP
jgi:Flp pilus assembly pilin Flp